MPDGTATQSPIKVKYAEANWNKTDLAVRRVKSTGFYEERGLTRSEKIFKGRHVIGRDTQINGGVYLGAHAREAIVVDDSKDMELQRIYGKVMRRKQSLQADGGQVRGRLIEEVWNVVQEEMPYDKENVDRITAGYNEPDHKVLLSAFLEGGICRHQALLAGYLIERMIKEGILQGRVSVDRNSVKGKGGHAWVRYTNSIGKIFIIDAARKYIGALDEVRQNRWFYERPEDVASRAIVAENIERKFTSRNR
jgi:hypothetical protein